MKGKKEKGQKFIMRAKKQQEDKEETKEEKVPEGYMSEDEPDAGVNIESEKAEP